MREESYMPNWNPWHGCTKISPGCYHCYVYRRDAEFDRDASVVHKTSSFDLPIKKNRRGEYKLKADGDFVYTCFTSDFFHPKADQWRIDAWKYIKLRSDLNFFFVTKRPDRFYVSLPSDWDEGYENVHICCTCENQEMTDKRLPVFLELPIRHQSIIHEPMLEAIDIRIHLEKYHNKIENVICGGESGKEARLCDYNWVLSTRAQCIDFGVPFRFKQTGAHFRKGNRTYHIERKYQMSQAVKAGIDYKQQSLVL
jgi:protein gp37